MPNLQMKRARFAIGGKSESQAIHAMEILPGTTFGPSVGFSVFLADGTSRVIEMRVDEAFNFAIELLSMTSVSTNKWELDAGADWRREAIGETES